MISLLKYTIAPSYHLFSLVMSCRSIISCDWVVKLEHIFREGNKVADTLANLGVGLSPTVTFFEQPPPYVIDIVFDDCMGISFPVFVKVD